MKVQATPGYYVTSKALGIILGYKVCRMSLPMVALWLLVEALSSGLDLDAPHNGISDA